MGKSKASAPQDDPLAQEIKTILDRYQKSFGPAQQQAYDRMMATLTGEKPNRTTKTASRHSMGHKPD